MKKIIFLLLLIFNISYLLAQNDVKAKIEFEEAEKAFQENNFEEAFTRLSKSQDILGIWSAKISYLKILSLDKLANYLKFENQDTQKLSKEVKLYLDYFNKNPDKIVEDKFKEVYRIDEKLNYSKKLSVYEKMPEYLQGIEAYDKKDYTAALQLWEQEAAKNNLLAMDKLSDMYRDEIGVKRDYEKSIELDTKAAAQGHIPSIADIGTMYYYGWGVTVDYQKAVEKLTIGAENGLDYAMFYLGRLYCDKKSTVYDNTKGIEWLTKATQLGHIRAMNTIAAINYTNNNFEKTMYWYKQAVEKGSTTAMIWIAFLYKDGLGVSINYPETIKWFQMAVNKGDIDAMYYTAYYVYYEGVVGKKDIPKAISLYTMVVEKGQGNPKEWSVTSNSMEALAKIYRTGDGVKKDKKLADEWQAKCDAIRAKRKSI